MGELRDELRSLLPERWTGRLVRAAALRGCDVVPEKLLPEYVGKMRDSTSRPGTAHELRLIGELLARNTSGCRCVPFPKIPNVDALISLGSGEVELEITAFVAPGHTQAIARVEQEVKKWLQERHPGRFYSVEISNLFVDFPSTQGGPFDEAAVVGMVTSELSRALDPNGNIRKDWRPVPRASIISEIQERGYTEIRQTGHTFPSATLDAQLQRKVLGKLGKKQRSGRRPLLLAVILDAWPIGDLLDRNGVSDAAFKLEDALAGIIEIPDNAEERCRLIFRVPQSPQASLGLGEGERAQLDDYFDFTYNHLGDILAI